MEFIIENWYMFVIGICAIAAAVVAGIKFFNMKTSTQLAKVREWLLWAVTEAEKALGKGTGAIKLRQVYDMFVVRFPWVARVISFALFSGLVDEALESMHSMLKTNTAIKTFVESGKDSK